MHLSVFCADIGSIPRGNFGWYGEVPEPRSGNDPEIMVEEMGLELSKGHHVSVGFECPLFVPVPFDKMSLTSARRGEGRRPWSAGAGCGALATGLTEVVWVLRVLRALQPEKMAYLDWSEFLAAETGLFIWEAFVSGMAKGSSHIDDAMRGVHAFQAASARPSLNSAITCDETYSLIGAAMLRSGWSSDVANLHKQCSVISA